jgi:uncharacterized protein (DUF2249 family)
MQPVCIFDPEALMTTTTHDCATPTLDLRSLVPQDRHARVFAAFDALRLGDAFELVNDHDPLPLYHQFRGRSPGNFAWHYLESGPGTWRVSIRKLGRAHGAGECCGVCGGGRA